MPIGSASTPPPSLAPVYGSVMSDAHASAWTCIKGFWRVALSAKWFNSPLADAVIGRYTALLWNPL